MHRVNHNDSYATDFYWDKVIRFWEVIKLSKLEWLLLVTMRIDLESFY